MKYPFLAVPSNVGLLDDTGGFAWSRVGDIGGPFQLNTDPRRWRIGARVWPDGGRRGSLPGKLWLLISGLTGHIPAGLSLGVTHDPERLRIGLPSAVEPP